MSTICIQNSFCSKLLKCGDYISQLLTPLFIFLPFCMLLLLSINSFIGIYLKILLPFGFLVLSAIILAIYLSQANRIYFRSWQSLGQMFAIVFGIGYIFFLAYSSFGNGLRLPIPSPVQDGAMQFTEILVLCNQRWESTAHGYPRGFHGSVVQISNSLSTIFNTNNCDVVLLTNIVALLLASICISIVLNVVLISLVYTSKKGNNIDLQFKILLSLLLVTLTTYFLTHALFQGFFAHLLAMYFIMTALLIEKITSEKTYSDVLVGASLGGALIAYSYSALIVIPAFGLYLFFSKASILKRLILFVLLLLPLLPTFFQFTNNATSVVVLVNAYGAYLPFSSLFLILSYIGILYGSRRLSGLFSNLLFAIVGILLTFGLYQLLTLQALQYSFYKLHDYLVLLGIPLVGISLTDLFNHNTVKPKIASKTEHVVGSMILLLFIVMVLPKLDMIQQFTTGKSNFFSNNAYFYNTATFLKENEQISTMLTLLPHYHDRIWMAAYLNPEEIWKNRLIAEAQEDGSSKPAESFFIIDPMQSLLDDCPASYEDAFKSELVEGYYPYSYSVEKIKEKCTTQGTKNVIK